MAPPDFSGAGFSLVPRVARRPLGWARALSPLVGLGGFPGFWFLLKVGVGSRLRRNIAQTFEWVKRELYEPGFMGLRDCFDWKGGGECSGVGYVDAAGG